MRIFTNAINNLRDRREIRQAEKQAAPTFRDIREVSVGLAGEIDDTTHARLARRHNGTPIFHVGTDGKERRAIRLDSVNGQEGEILIDYRSELRHLRDCLADYLQIPSSARH